MNIYIKNLYTDNKGNDNINNIIYTLSNEYNNKIQYNEIVQIYAEIIKKVGFNTVYKIEQNILEKYNIPAIYSVNHLVPDIDGVIWTRFKCETYGLFERFKWANFIICGTFISKLAANIKCTNEPFYFILYTKKYNIMRERLNYFCNFIITRFVIKKEELSIEVNNNKITFYIPGFERGIVLQIVFEDSLNTILNNNMYYSNGIYIKENTAYSTIFGIQYIISNNFCVLPKVTKSISYKMQKTIPSTIGINKLINTVYGIYTLHLHLNNRYKIPKLMYSEWYYNTDIKDQINVDFQDNAEHYRIYVTTPNNSNIEIDTNITSIHILLDFLKGLLYKDRKL